jgi:hypothetical protein
MAMDRGTSINFNTTNKIMVEKTPDNTEASKKPAEEGKKIELLT